jgi:hypothetical protein
MSSLESGFGGGVEDMMSGAECQSGRITEESYFGTNHEHFSAKIHSVVPDLPDDSPRMFSMFSIT